jgi:CheY-like chemotaxis protein
LTDPKDKKGPPGTNAPKRAEPRPIAESSSPPPPGIRFIGRDDPLFRAFQDPSDGAPAGPEYGRPDPFAEDEVRPTDPDLIPPGLSDPALAQALDGEPKLVIGPRMPGAAALGAQPSLSHRPGPSNRDRGEQPTQPIDLSGYQELPLPSPSIAHRDLAAQHAERLLETVPSFPDPFPPSLAARTVAQYPPAGFGAERGGRAPPLAQDVPSRRGQEVREAGDPGPARSTPPTSPHRPLGAREPAIAPIRMNLPPAPAMTRTVATPFAPSPASPSRAAGVADLPSPPLAVTSATSAPPQAAEAVSPSAALIIPPEPTIRVALPANILVVDDDARAGSLVAARLLEHGYGCRVVRGSAAREAIANQTFDAIILEVPPAEAQGDHGAERLALIADYKGPVVLSSSTVLNRDRLQGARIGAILTKPYFVDVLIQSIEAARVFALGTMDTRESVLRTKEEDEEEEAATALPEPRAPTEKKPAPAADIAPAAPKPATRGRDRRAFVRHEFDTEVVRAVLVAADGKETRGRIRNMSPKGGLMVETTARYAPRAGLTAEFVLLDGRMMIFTGRVVRSSVSDLALKLDVDDAQIEFLERFIEDTRSPNQKNLQPVKVAPRVEGTTADIIDDMSLMKLWLEVSESLDNDDMQQQFIQHCLKAEKLEFAVARYRELKAQRPDDERVAKYLHQIGTILGFYALSKKEAVGEKQKLPSSIKLMIVLFALAGLALIFAARHFMVR